MPVTLLLLSQMEVTILQSLKCIILLVVALIMTTNGGDPFEESCVGRIRQRVSQCQAVESYNPWPTNNNCNGLKISSHPVATFHTRAVFAFPSSGLSWLLQMIERTSGALTGTFSEFTSNTQESSGQVRCGLTIGDGKTIIQGNSDSLFKLVPNWYAKLYLPNNGTVSTWLNFAKVHFASHGVLLVRNPFHAITNARADIRRNLRICTMCKKSAYLMEEKDFQPKYFYKYFEKAAKEWVYHIKSWVKKSPDGSASVMVKYETLMQNPELSIRRIMRYLNVTMDEQRLKCALGDPIRFRERIIEHKTRSFISMFLEEDLSLRASGILENGMDEINEMLRLRGIPERLNYKKPTYSDVLRNKDAWRSRIALS